GSGSASGSSRQGPRRFSVALRGRAYTAEDGNPRDKQAKARRVPQPYRRAHRYPRCAAKEVASAGQREEGSPQTVGILAGSHELIPKVAMLGPFRIGTRNLQFR